jgi:hypothetical protein
MGAQNNGGFDMNHTGVTTVDGIRDRCRIDDETGCWNWAWGRSDHANSATPSIHIGKGVLGNERRKQMSAHSAAWLLSGKKLAKGHVVYRACCNIDCCNPAHLKAGPRSDMYAHYSASGKNKGQHHRKIANAKNRQKMMAPRERVLMVEQLLAAGTKIIHIKEKMGMCTLTIRDIRDGMHPNCSKPIKSNLISGASVFSLGAL